MERPCSTCKVELFDGNQDAAKIYLKVRGQLIVGISGVVDLNQSTLISVMELYRVENKVKCFEKVMSVFREFQKEYEKEHKK